MVEKTQNDEAASREATPEAAATPEPGEIKACVGATGGGEGASAPLPPEEI